MEETFRERLGILDKKGARNWIYAKQPKGYFYNWRKLLTYILLTALFVTPFIKIDGHPFMLFNILGREFIIFGVFFAPQDFYIFALVMIFFVVFIIVFTIAFGRLFCGWVCPQTIFLEMLFRRIEYWIEGDANQQRKLNEEKWYTSKIIKKTVKHILFFALSFWIANTFLAYLIGIDALYLLVVETPFKHLYTFSALVIFTGVFYGNFAFFRELSCIIVCPYGRLQSVLLDKNSIVVAYDYIRGEPRGKIKKNELLSSEPKGDCVACSLCVQVCPTGIDIRNGTQLECVNCTACIDACDEVMVKTHQPTGLIRYASEENIKHGAKLTFNSRLTSYSIVLFLLATLIGFLLFTRPAIQVQILRAQGTLFYEVNPQTLSNLYNIELMNKTFKKMNVEIKIKNNVGKIKWIDGINEFSLDKKESRKSTFFIEMPKENLKNISTKIELLIFINGKVSKIAITQ